MISNQRLFSKYESTIKDDYAIVLNSLKGMKVNVFFDLASIAGLKKQQLADEIFRVSLKTITRYQKDNKRFDPRNSELALKLIVLYKKGVEIFGETQSFNRWLNKPAFGLGDQIPYQLMNTSTGIDLILEELIRIEFGATA
ncbi:MAG: antitoxin Xre/MbcA/ParS toxin-binding domain-containing protein [Tunicatimonas sp.]|uniref:type II RES/Xre toxin-antitoxin system antitoxin n=1 Tax=Tunicatimonas sp. TaxID=1940096 RepID=UPI003C77F836